MNEMAPEDRDWLRQREFARARLNKRTEGLGDKLFNVGNSLVSVLQELDKKESEMQDAMCLLGFGVAADADNDPLDGRLKV